MFGHPRHRFNEFSNEELLIIGAALFYYKKRIDDGSFIPNADRDKIVADLKADAMMTADGAPCYCLGCSIKRTELEEE